MSVDDERRNDEKQGRRDEPGEHGAAGEYSEMTGEGAVPVPDTGIEPRQDGDGAHQVLDDGLRSEMTAEGAELEPDGTDTEMTAEGAVPAERTQAAERRTDR
jgi:hypothetical protein